MADWIHCNSCYRKPNQNRRFSLTNCGHIYCEDCVAPGSSKQNCKMCNNPFTTIPLTAKMKPEVELFFTSPVDLLKKNVKQMQKIIQVMDFQQNHAKRLNVYNASKMAKQENAVYKAQKSSSSEVRDLERQVMVLKDENSYLKKVLNSKGGQSGRATSPMARLSPGSSQSSTQRSPYGSSQPHSQQHPQSNYSIGSGPSGMSASQHTKGPSRIRVWTPPGQGRYGLPRTPSPKSSQLASTGSHGDASLPGHHDNRQRTSGGVGGSPMSVSPHGAQSYRTLLSVPPVCMPITPNRPQTPNYTMDCSPAECHVTYSQQPSSQRNQIQIKYPLKSGYKTS